MAQDNQAKDMQEVREEGNPNCLLPAQKAREQQTPFPFANASSYVVHKPEVGPVRGNFTPFLWGMDFLGGSPRTLEHL